MFENENFEEFYENNFPTREYNINVKECCDNYMDESNDNIFSRSYLNNDEFLENFMKIGYGSPLRKNFISAKNSENDKNDSASTHSSSNNKLNNSNSTYGSNVKNKELFIEIENNLKEEQLDKDFNFTKQKKGRPMTDTNVIYDEINQKYYDINVDPLEYKKARK